MTIIQLETFLKITETGSFTAAANLLGYAQSTVTTQIKMLEEELGCLLFERLGKTVALTPEGERLTAYAEKMMQTEREIRLEVPAKEEVAGILRLGVSESLCYNRLPKVLLEYREKFPKMDIQLSFVMHDSFPAQLKKGNLDLVYSLNPVLACPDLEVLYDRPEELGFFASPAHPLAKRKGITEKDLEGVPLLLTSHTCSFRHMLLEDLEKAGVTPRIALETSSKEILRQFAVNELGVAFMPEMTVRNELEKGLLKKLDWAGQHFPIFSRVLVHRDKHVSRAMRELIGIISENAGDD